MGVSAESDATESHSRRPQQTRSSTLRSLDWLPVIVQTAPTAPRQAGQLFASACEDSRFLHSAGVPEPELLRRIALPHFRFGMFQSYDYSFALQWQRKHTKVLRALILSGLGSSPSSDRYRRGEHRRYYDADFFQKIMQSCWPFAHFFVFALDLSGTSFLFWRNAKPTNPTSSKSVPTTIIQYGNSMS